MLESNISKHLQPLALEKKQTTKQKQKQTNNEYAIQLLFACPDLNKY